MKKIITSLLFTVMLATCILSAKADYMPELIKGMPLLKYNGYANITPFNIKSVKIVKYTEGGAIEQDITSKAEIGAIYNYLNNLKISDETKMCCEDNTTIFIFTLENNVKLPVEIECDWVVLKGKRYLIDK